MYLNQRKIISKKCTTQNLRNQHSRQRFVENSLYKTAVD